MLMLIFNRGTGGDADDRDVIQGNFSCPNLCNATGLFESHLQISQGLGQRPNSNIFAEGDHINITKSILVEEFYNLMIDENVHYYKTKNIHRYFF